MPERFCSAARGSDHRREYAAFVVATGISLGLVAAAAAAIYFWLAVQASPLLIPAACVLLASGAWQGWLLVDLLRRRCWQRVRATYFCVQFWQSLLSGAAILYLAALALGPISGIGWAWLAAVALWQNGLLVSLTASPQVAENWRRWMETHRPGRLNWLVAASVALLGLGEGTLRVHGVFRGDTRTAESDALARLQANAGGFDVDSDWTTFDTAALAIERTRLRVALLSEDPQAAAALSRRIQQAVVGAEVVALEVALADTDDARLAAELASSRPDVVLAVMPACRQWAPEVVRRSLFDRDRFELSRVVFGAAEQVKAEAAPAADYESFLNTLSGDLAACQTPQDDAMRARWERTFAALDGAVDTCRTANVPLALVVVPGELQLDEALRATLTRRNGLAPEQVDVELPQRRLAGYAAEREVPLVDLLPQLRLSRQVVFNRQQTELSERGNIVAAAAIGGWLESQYGGQISEQLSRNK